MVNKERFNQDVKIGNTIWIQPAIRFPGKNGIEELDTVVVKEILDEGIYVLKTDSQWENQPIWVDMEHVSTYYVMDKTERKAPFMDEIQKICDMIDEDHPIQMLSLNILRKIPGNENIEVKQRAESIWASSEIAKDAYAIDENIRKCTRAIIEYGEQYSLKVLRGYNRYRYGILTGDMRKIKEAEQDFSETNFRRGLYFCKKDKDPENVVHELKECLITEQTIDPDILFTYVKHADQNQRKQLIADLRTEGEIDRESVENIYQAALYTIYTDKKDEFRLPDESALFSIKNVNYIMGFIPKSDKPVLAENTDSQKLPVHAIESLNETRKNEPEKSSDPEKDGETKQDKNDYPRTSPYTGSIRFLMKNKSGFIALDKDCNFLGNDDLFFYVNYVKNDHLRSLLYTKLDQLEDSGSINFNPGEIRVSFYLFENTFADDDICAGAIEWTNEPDTQENEACGTAVSGDIVSFSSVSRRGDAIEKGWIDADNKRYGFALPSVDDLMLREFLKNYWGGYGGEEPISVSFFIRNNQAVHICRKEEELPNHTNQMVAEVLKPEETEKWLHPSIPASDPVQNHEEQKSVYVGNYREPSRRWTKKLPTCTRKSISAASSVVLKPTEKKTESVSQISPAENPINKGKEALKDRPSFRDILHKEPFTASQSELYQEIRQKQGDESRTEAYRDACLKLLRDEDAQQVVTPAAGLLVQYYINTNDYLSAIELLDVIGEELDSDDIIHRRVWFSREKYLNRRISALEKARASGETRYLDELYDLYRQKQLYGSATDSQKYHYQYQRAFIRYTQNRYMDAVRDFQECEDIIDNSSSMSEVVKEEMTCRLWLFIADCYLASGDRVKAEDFAKRIIKPAHRQVNGIQEMKAQAEGILNGNRPMIISDTQKTKNKKQNPTGNTEYNVDNEEEDYPRYIRYLMNNFSLSDVFEGSTLRRIAENRTYVDNAYQRNSLTRYLREGLNNAATNANTLNADLSMAMFLVLNSSNASTLSANNKNEAYIMLGNSLRWKADEYIRIGRSAAPQYLYTLAALYANEKDYSIYLRRAIGSVFREYLSYARGGIYQDLAGERMEYISRFYDKVFDRTNPNRDTPDTHSLCIKIFTSIFETARPNYGPSDPIKKELRKELIQTLADKLRLLLYREDEGLFRKAFIETGGMNPAELTETIMDPASFVSLFENAIQRWDYSRRDFERMLLTSTGSSVISTLEIENREQLRRFISRVQGHEVYKINAMGKTADARQTDEFISILNSWLTYFSQKSFSERISALNQIADRLEGLKQSISENPTAISYELILPNAETVLNHVYATMDDLYRIEPQLSLSVVDDNAAVSGKDNIRFEIVLSNDDEDRQSVTVTGLKIRGEDPDINIHDGYFSNQFNSTIGGGKTSSYEVIADVTEAIFQEAYFSVDVTVEYSYQYAHGAQRQRTKEQILHGVVNLKKVRFSLIENPYNPKNIRKKTLVERMDIFNALRKNIQGSERSGVVLWGQKRTGKTVILEGLKSFCPSWNNETSRYIYVNTEMMETRSTDPYEDPYKALLSKILSEIARSIEGRGVSGYHEYEELKEITGYLKKAKDEMNAATNPRQYFLDTLAELGEFVDKKTIGKSYNYHLVIAIDEFTACLEMFDKGSIESKDLIFWKKLVEFNNIPVHLILVAHDNWRELLGMSMNALSVFDPIQVSYMTIPEAEQLILKHMMVESVDGKPESRFRNDCHERIIQLTARSPFLIQEVCKQLIDYMNDEQMVYIVREQLEKFLAEKVTGESGKGLDADFFDPQLSPKRAGDTGEQNRILLQAFARSSGNPETDWISMRSINIQMPGELVNKLLDELDQHHRDIVERKWEGDGDQLIRFRVPLLGAWLKYRL